MNIEIVTTPNDNLKETGFGPHLVCQSILQSLLDTDHIAVVTICDTITDLYSIIQRKPDLVVIVVKYINLKNGEKLWLSDFFEENDIAYTGSPKHILSYDSNKASAKSQVSAEGIDTADFFVTVPGQHQTEEDLPISFPLFIKPSDSANGNGIDVKSLVLDFEHYQEKVNSIYDQYNENVLVEEYLGGPEFTVAVIENNRDIIVAPVEIIPPEEGGIRILGSKVKNNNTEILKLIADTDILSKVIDIAEKSFCALGARDFGRIDIKMDHRGQCQFIEANLVPGMKRNSSYFPRAFEMNFGLDYETIVILMIQGAIRRRMSFPERAERYPTAPSARPPKLWSGLRLENLHVAGRKADSTL